jgi:hypothetical protein
MNESTQRADQISASGIFVKIPASMLLLFEKGTRHGDCYKLMSSCTKGLSHEIESKNLEKKIDSSSFEFFNGF